MGIFTVPAPSNQAIPRAWPDARSSPLTRAIYDIALSRFIPGQSVEKTSFFLTRAMGSPALCYMRASASRYGHYIDCGESSGVWRRIVHEGETESSGGIDVILFALWLAPERPFRYLHAWPISFDTVKEMQELVRRHGGQSGNVTIKRNADAGRWEWCVSGRGCGATPIDLSHIHQLWELDGFERTRLDQLD